MIVELCECMRYDMRNNRWYCAKQEPLLFDIIALEDRRKCYKTPPICYTIVVDETKTGKNTNKTL